MTSASTGMAARLWSAISGPASGIRSDPVACGRAENPNAATITPEPSNPYRQILRRHLPEPLLVLLIFIMGVWLWDNHFGPAAEYDQETCRMTLRKIDRNLRLASAAEGLPAPLCRGVGIPSMDEALRDGVEDLLLLARHGAMDREALHALRVLSAMHNGVNPAAISFPETGFSPPDVREISGRFLNGSDQWWDLAYLTGLRDLGGPDLSPPGMTAFNDPRNHDLVKKAASARGAVLVLALMGAGFIPRAMRAAGEALRTPSRGYTGSWKPGLGLGVFLLSYLASIGFSLGIEQLIRGPGDGSRPVPLGMPTLLALDTAARLLPALVALALLFRKGGHAVSRMGLLKKPDFGLILGGFAFLTALDRLLRPTLGAMMPPDPTGGLATAEDGGWGLAYALVSACMVAPVAEEILYRGVLFQTLSNRFRVAAATFVSAAVFAVVHFYDAYGIVSVGLFGASCALCYRTRGSLSTAIIFHGFYNIAIKFPEWIVYHLAL